MNITEKINSFHFVSDAEELNQFLAGAKADYVFWHGRIIMHDDYKGYYRINKFRCKVDLAIPFGIISSAIAQKDYERAAEKLDQLSLKERVCGINNLKLLYDFCGDAHSAWKNKNIFVRIAIVISEFFRDLINPDYVVCFKQDVKNQSTWNFVRAGFHSFSEEKLKEVFLNWKQLQDENKIKIIDAYAVEYNDKYLPVYRYYVETSVIEDHA